MGLTGISLRGQVRSLLDRSRPTLRMGVVPVLGGIWEIAFCRAGLVPSVWRGPAGELALGGARLVRRGTALADCRAAGHARRSGAASLPHMALARVIPDALRWRWPRHGVSGWQHALHLRYTAGCRPCAAPGTAVRRHARRPRLCGKGYPPGAPVLSRVESAPIGRMAGSRH
jgi:hypothetical protein